MFIEKIAQSQLFQHIEKHKLRALLQQLNPRRRSYQKGEYIHHINDVYGSIGVILSGKVAMSTTDFWGNRNLIKEFKELEFYGDSHSISKLPMFFDIIAVRNSELLFLDVDRILTPWNDLEMERQTLMTNLLNICAHKKLDYMHKADYLSRRNVRDKIKAYLSEQARSNKSNSFVIPFNRQHLADYLAVDRSTLSRELSKMKAQGMLEFDDKHFTLMKMEQ